MSISRSPRLQVRSSQMGKQLLSGALFSHIAVGDPVAGLIPSMLLLIMAVLSWHFRPADRKLNAAEVSKS